MRARHRHSRQATEDVDGADEIDVDADVDKADDAGIGTINPNGAADDLAQRQYMQTKRTRHK